MQPHALFVKHVLLIPGARDLVDVHDYLNYFVLQLHLIHFYVAHPSKPLSWRNALRCDGSCEGVDGKIKPNVTGDGLRTQ